MGRLGRTRYDTDALAELHTSGCLCVPGTRAVDCTCGRVGCTLWVRRADGTWWRSAHRSIHRAGQALSEIEPDDTWEAVAYLLRLAPANHPEWHEAIVERGGVGR